MHSINRRRFLGTAAGLAMAAPAGMDWLARACQAFDKAPPAPFRPGRLKQMDLGLVTYLWGEKWDLPTLIANCEASKVLGVELRTTHKHGVEPSLDKAARDQVKKRFADTPVKLVGLGSNERFDHVDPKALTKAIDETKRFIELCADVGGSGVKVKPDSFQKGVPREKTIEQIGKSLQDLGPFAQQHKCELRLEVHGGCAELPTIAAIMAAAPHPAVCVCWNSNKEDLGGKGLEHNFKLIQDRLGSTAHTRTLDSTDYPYQKLLELMVAADFRGWVMLEVSGGPEDKVAALKKQRELFDAMAKAAGSKPA